MDTSKAVESSVHEHEENEFELSDLDPACNPPVESERRFSQNQIIAAVERCFSRRGQVHFVGLKGHRFTPEEMRSFIIRVFDADALQAIGILVVESLITGDADFVTTIKEAIKQADRLFHRNREIELLGKFGPFVFSFGDNVPPKSVLLRLFAEKNNGKRPTEQQWRRLRKALNLQEGKTGRPRKPDTKE